MNMNKIELKSHSKKTAKRVGRGISAGQGKTSGRGTKGQKSRSGFNIPNRFEGGQTPLSMRLPKLKGFKAVKSKAIVISLDLISKNFRDGEIVSSKTLAEKKLIRPGEEAKILNNGTLSKKVKFDGVRMSKKVEGKLAKTEATEKKPSKAKETIVSAKKA